MRLSGSILTLVTVLVLGTVIGIASTVLFLTGVQGAPLSRTAAQAEPDSAALTGMERLERFQCARGETKQIVLRGVEDDFSRTGDETIARGALYLFQAERFSHGSVGVERVYDDDRLDQVLVDSLTLSSRTASGLIVMRIREWAQPRNDTITIGDLINKAEDGHAHIETFIRVEAGEASPWTAEGEFFQARLKDLDFPRSDTAETGPLPRRYANLLEWVRGGETDVSVEYAISEDTMVDFVGVAACLEPPAHQGTSFLVTTNPSDNSIVSLSCSDKEERGHCDPYVGDTACSVALPLACLNPQDLPVPETALGFIDRMAWTGADIRFTPPVAGSSIPSQSQGHALCATQFGDGWRMMNIHDGLMVQSIIGRGAAPHPSQAWLDSPDQQYGNCWDLDGTDADQ